MFTVSERSNENDIPKPAREKREYVIMLGNFMADAPPFPHTDAGLRDAKRVARLLNYTADRAKQNAQRAMREALGL